MVPTWRFRRGTGPACAGAGKARFFDPCLSRANGARAHACVRRPRFRPLLSDPRKLGVESSPGSGGAEAVCFWEAVGWLEKMGIVLCVLNQ